MSWLARSIANSLKLDDDDHTDPNIPADTKPLPDSDQHSDSSSSSPRGVKEDLSELTKTLARQFWGVASFLAPPPPGSATASPSSPRQISDEPPKQRQQLLDPDQPAPDQNEDLMAGIRSDFAEIGGKFRSGFSKLSSNIPVSEISKIASNFLQIGSEADEDLIGTAVGVTEEVVAFARDVAMHPETWLDFPVPDDDFDDFDMSDAQQEHALAVERLAPRLAALRMELCPGYMSDGCFWKIYFVLVHPRLNKEDALLLSTPQIVEVRAMLSLELKNRREAKTNPGSEMSMTGSEQNSGLQREEFLSVPSGSASESMPPKTSSIEVFPSTIAAKTSCSEAVPSGVPLDLETEKHPVQSTEIQIIDKAVVEEEPVNQAKHQHSSGSRIVDDKFEDDGDDWLKEESSEIGGTTGTTIPIGNDEDVSFSDLEDDDTDVPVSHQKVNSGSDTSTKDSRDWVQLSRSSADSVKDISPVSVKHAGSEQVSARNSESKEHNDWLDVDDIDVL